MRLVFGHDSGFVAGLVIFVVFVLVVWAFRQGRSVRLGNLLYFGSRRPARTGAASEVETTDAGRDDRRLAGVARLFDVEDSAEFYSLIAVNYDQRNSVNLLNTHMEVITRIEDARRTKPDLKVLDLGGGTGQNVATYFFSDPGIRWTYVDFCPAMVDQLQQHLAGRPLYDRLRVHVDDINRIHQRVPSGGYDIVLLSLVLSSMPQLPDFRPIADLLASDGQLLISDIDPRYAAAHPYDKATAADGRHVALRIQAVQPLEVVTRLREVGLRPLEMSAVGAGRINYAFVATFGAAVLTDPGRRKHDSANGLS